MTVDIKAVEEKVTKGEKLTSEEETVLLKNEGPVEGYTKVPVEDMKPEDFDEAEETTAKPEDKKPAEPAKPAEPPAVDPNDPFMKLERELAKDEKDANLEGFTEREKAYYHQMRRDRKTKQTAEAERDAVKFENIKLKQAAPVKPEDKKPDETDPIEELKKKDPTDFLTVAEVVNILEKQGKTSPKKTDPEPNNDVDPVRMRYLQMCDAEARAQFTTDYDYVMELSEELIETNKDHLRTMAAAMAKGDNPAVTAYNLIKGDPEFTKLYEAAKTKVEARKAAKKPDPNPAKAEPKAGGEPPAKTPEQLKKDNEAKKAQEALEKKKPKTTGNIESSNNNPGGDDHTEEEIIKMSPLEFAKLPKKKRDAYLRKYG